MQPKIKKFIKKNKKQIKIGLIVLLILIVVIFLFKSLFYSSSEKAVYGVRLRGIENNKISNKQKDSFIDKSSSIEGVSKVELNIKGRLIKVFVTFKEDVTSDDIKTKLTDMTSYFSDKIKGYYDIELYSIQKKDKNTTYPVIGYKHKNSSEITFDVH